MIDVYNHQVVINDPVRRTVINAALSIILLASQSLYPKDLVILAWNLELVTVCSH